MSKLSLALVIVGIIVIAAGGLAYYSMFKGKAEVAKDTVNVVEVKLYVDTKKVTEVKTPIEIHVGINNEFPVNIKVKSGDLSLITNDLSLVKIIIPSQEIKRGYSVIVVNAVIDNMLMDEFWYRHLRQGEITNVKLQGTLILDTPIGGIEVPISYSKLLKTNMFPKKQTLNKEYDLGVVGKIIVKSIKMDLAGVTPSETEIKAYLTIENKLRNIPLYINGLVFRLKLPGEVILGSGEQEYRKLIAPGETDTIAFNIILDNSKIPTLWYRHVKNKETTNIIVEVWLKVKVAERTIELFKKHPLTITIQFRTNMFNYRS